MNLKQHAHETSDPVITRPYTTAELLKLLNRHRTYINVVIMSKSRKTPHPLKAAYLTRGMWDKRIVDQYFEK
jgi:glucose-6-phosphate isomerase